MKKKVLLSFYLLCACSISACSSVSDDAKYESTENTQVIDATIEPSDKCGADGISCNDSALINYTKTEADYRAYGERTKRDHLYTQAATGNNLTATVRPGIEEDIVTEYTDEDALANGNGIGDDGFSNNDLFMQTASNDIDPQAIIPQGTLNGGNAVIDGSANMGDNQVGHANSITGPGFEIVCTEECDEFADLNDEADGDAVTSEFTEESFDLVDYIKSNSDDEDINFVEVGDETEVAENVDIDVKDSTVKEAKDDSIQTWDAREGDNLRELLAQWSARAGWKLLWNTNRNYTLTAGAMFKGKFTDVSSALIRAFARARPAPIATYYKGNRVIVVETMENENAY